MGKDDNKDSQLYISNEGLCGRKIPISRAEFEKARAQVIKEEFGNNPQNQNDNKPKDKPQQ